MRFFTLFMYKYIQGTNVTNLRARSIYYFLLSMLTIERIFLFFFLEKYDTVIGATQLRISE